jgi:2-dehydro-3-deoxygalactonokinase
MTSKHLFIAGDWGTSNLRLYLCKYHADKASTVIETRFGPGISQINGDFEEKFFNLSQDWLDHYGPIPVLLSGMVGSTIGWKDAPYLSCPVDVNQIASGRVSFQARGIDFSILAGLKTNNPLGSPDIMRGEELQLLGWLRLNQQDHGSRLFALPGTHNKWSLVEDGTISNFLTAYTGELFSLLRSSSILITDDSAINFNHDAFMQGVQAIESLGAAHLVHALFATRSKQVLGEMPASDGLSYLSGLLTAADVIGAMRLFDNTEAVTVIGEETLTNQYMLVFEHLNIAAQACDPAQIAIAGFEAIYQKLHT